MVRDFGDEYIDITKFKKFKEDTRRFNEITNNTKKCKCGHSVLINAGVDKVLCTWCNNYVFKDKKTEDLYRVKEKLK